MRILALRRWNAGSGNTSNTRWLRPARQSKKSWTQSRRLASPEEKRGKREVITNSEQRWALGGGAVEISRACPVVDRASSTLLLPQNNKNSSERPKMAEPSTTLQSIVRKARSRLWCILSRTDSGARGVARGIGGLKVFDFDLLDRYGVKFLCLQNPKIHAANARNLPLGIAITRRKCWRASAIRSGAARGMGGKSLEHRACRP